MKIGLLECDHVRAELVHIAGDYRQMFPALFEKVAPNWEFEFFDVCNGHFPESVTQCDAYICTGSKSSVYDVDAWIMQLKDFVADISNSRSVFVGVCFGHQILGEALGGKVEKSPRGWCVGAHTFEVKATEEWMEPALSTFNLLMMCQDQVVKLPEGARLLAFTPDCAHGMFTVGNNMLGIQAHPEFTKTYDQALMELRVERIGAAVVEKGIASLRNTLHAGVVAGWIHKFIESER